MNVSLLPAVVASVFGFCNIGAAQESLQVSAKAARIFMLLVQEKGETILQPVSRIENVPFDTSCFSLSKLSMVCDGDGSHLYAIDAKRYLRGRNRRADRIELVFDERGGSFQGDCMVFTGRQ